MRRDILRFVKETVMHSSRRTKRITGGGQPSRHCQQLSHRPTSVKRFCESDRPRIVTKTLHVSSNSQKRAVRRQVTTHSKNEHRQDRLLTKTVSTNLGRAGRHSRRRKNNFGVVSISHTNTHNHISQK